MFAEIVFNEKLGKFLCRLQPLCVEVNAGASYIVFAFAFTQCEQTLKR